MGGILAADAYTAYPARAMQPPAILAQRLEHVPIDSIRPHPENPNEGDPDAIADAADEVGFYQVIFVQRSTGRILVGEHRWRALAGAGSSTAPVVFLDVDDDRARRIMVGDNELPRRHSRPDERALAALLSGLAATAAGLRGTGVTDDGLAALLSSLAPPEPPPSFPDAEALAGHVEYRCPRCAYEWSGSPTPESGMAGG